VVSANNRAWGWHTNIVIWCVMEGLMGVASLNNGGWGQCNHRWCCECWYGCEGATEVAAMVLLSLLMALAITLFTCIVSGWVWCGRLTLCMHVICVLSSLPLHPPPLSCVHPVVCPHMHPFTFVFWPMLVCIVLIRVCCAPSRLSICTE
jgi:hypothetical protein